MSRNISKWVYRVLLWSFFAVLGGKLVEALISRRRRPFTPLVVGRDWQAVAAEAISPAQPVLVRLATWAAPPELDEPYDAVIYETRDAVGTELHEPEDADEQRDAVGTEPPRRGSYRPIARRGPPTDDSIQGDQ